MPKDWGLTEKKDKPRARVARPDYGVYKPPDNETAPTYRDCWCEKRIHTSSMYSRYVGCYDRCQKHARPGHLTCAWHKHFEGEAQALLEKEDEDV